MKLWIASRSAIAWGVQTMRVTACLDLVVRDRLASLGLLQAALDLIQKIESLDSIFDRRIGRELFDGL